MGWVMRERRGPEWKHGWVARTISSISAPPRPLMALFAVIGFYLYLSSYFACRAEMHRTFVNFRLFLLLLPLLFILIIIILARTTTTHQFAGGKCWRSSTTVVVWSNWIPRPEQSSIHRAGSSPWGLALLLVLLLLLLSYQPYFHSKWLRPLWHPAARY